MKEFIAWDKEKKEWSDQSNDKYSIEIYLDGSFSALEKVYEDDYWYWVGRESKDFTLYQYIGRLDKNGDKVYEGSKIRVPNGRNEYRVEYDKDSCGYVLRIIPNRDQSQLETLEACWILKFSDGNYFEVTGHIAEDDGEDAGYGYDIADGTCKCENTDDPSSRCQAYDMTDAAKLKSVRKRNKVLERALEMASDKIGDCVGYCVEAVDNYELPSCERCKNGEKQDDDCWFKSFIERAEETI